MQLECKVLSSCLHILFTLALFSFFRGRGSVWANDIRYNLNSIIHRNFETTSGSGSVATIVNSTTLQTPTHIMHFLQGPVLDTIFQCGQETQGGTCDTNSTSTYTQYTILGNLELHQFRTASTLGRSGVDTVGCDGTMGSRPRLYYLLDSSTTQRTALESSTLKCYSSYDPQFEDTSTFGNDTDNTFSYDADYIVDGIETDRHLSHGRF